LIVVLANGPELRDHRTKRKRSAEYPNAPAISMGQYQIESDQVKLLTTISIYAQHGESRDQMRLPYMNAPALLIWKAMGKQPKLIGSLHRPPKTALLAFGVPFSE
jgi:hypothetical protein